MSQFDEDFQRGMDMLFAANSDFAKFTVAMGKPVPTYAIPTAAVQWDGPNKQILFMMNPDFIAGLTDEQLGAVIAHETYHVVLDHLAEAADQVTFPRVQERTLAQEVIINDGLFEHLGLQLPKGGDTGGVFGPETFGHDFTDHTTPEAYAFICSLNPQEEEDESDGSEDTEASGATPGASGSGGRAQGAPAQAPAAGSSNPEEASSGTPMPEDASQEEAPEAGQGTDEDAEAATAGSGASEDDAAGGDEAAQELPEVHGCGGVQVSPEDLEGLQEHLKEVAGQLKDAVGGLPQDMQEALEALDPLLAGRAAGHGAPGGSVFANQVISMNMNWYALLQEINPKLKQVGRPKPKDTWHRPNRKAMSIYPQVILPTKQEAKDDDNFKKGNSKPLLIVALDLSGSIPRHLVNKLVSLVDDVPEKFIKAIPVTWSDSVVEYDPEKKALVRSGGTDIDAVYEYAEKKGKELGVTPYVLVITDGVASFGWSYSAKPVDKEKVQKYWYWAAIQPQDEHVIKRNFRDCITEKSVFKLEDFTS